MRMEVYLMFKHGNIWMFVALMAGLLVFRSAPAQEDEYVYYKNFVKHEDGSSCEHLPPEATFTAFLNRDSIRLLIESAPRWVENVDPNINGKGAFGVELGNFSDPSVAAGDSVFIRFTCNATGQQSVLKAYVNDIPWYYFPQTLNLSDAAIPEPPGDVRVRYNEQHQRIVDWEADNSLSFDVYRTNLLDTIARGLPKRQYRRIAEDLTETSFLDTTNRSEAIFSYIVYARSPQGVYSSHSREAMEGPLVQDFAVTPGVTTVRLDIGEYEPALGDLKGYNIYRRSGTDPWQIVGYSGLGNAYIDSRLQANHSYEYMVAARTSARTEFGESEVITVTTQPSSSQYYYYANLKVAVVIYQNTNGGAITNPHIPKIKRMLNLGRQFYWRNSGMKLNIEFTYYPISEYRDFGDPDNLNVGMTIEDLKSEGVMNTQYDIIFRITPATAGFWSIGVQSFNLEGPERKTGFSQSYWPVGTGVQYPGTDDDINYGLTWIFVHECQHAIDALYNANRHSEMSHGDLPWQFPVACGEHYDFQAKMFRDFEAYTDLLPLWGGIYETTDADEDGFPDEDAFLPMDEKRFNSEPGKSDSDGDRLNDRDEYLNGVFGGSDPQNIDSDGDGTADGDDPYPRYPLDTRLEIFSPKIDGIIENGWPLVNDEVSFAYEAFSPKLYMSYDADYFYIALTYGKYAEPRFSFDFHNDGWWHSSGNTFMRIDVKNGHFNEFRSWDASPEVKQYSLNNGGPGGMWDTDNEYQQQFERRVIMPGSVQMSTVYEAPKTTVEMAIPRSEYAGLTLNEGDRIAFNINYYNLDNHSGQWASTFDKYSFASVRLGEATPLAKESIGSGVQTFRLRENYPNPFNRRTVIRYELPHTRDVGLHIYNALGQRVRTLLNEQKNAGKHQVIWDGRNDAGSVVPSGIYFYRIIIDGKARKPHKMLLVK